MVYIEEIRKFSTADPDGNYALDDIPYGTYTIAVKTLTAEDFVARIKIDGDRVAYSAALKRKGNFNLRSVKVYAKSEAQELRDRGFAMGMVDTRRMEVHSFGSNELLDRTAGVRIRQTGGMGSDVQYNINGLSGNAVRVFIDGIPIRNFGSSFSLSSLPPAMIERIEVYKGVVPTDLAEDALGGAINVVLRHRARNSLATSYSFGSFNTHRWDMNGSYRHSGSGFTVNGSAFYNSTDNSYKVWGDQIYITEPTTGEITRVKTKRFHDGYMSYGVNADMGFTDVRWADRLLIGVVASEMEKDIQHGASMAKVYGNRTSGQHTLMGNVKYEKRDLLKNLDANLFASYSRGVRTVVDTTNYKYSWSGDIYRKPNGDYVRWSTTGEGGNATLDENTEMMGAARASLSYRFVAGHKLNVNYLYNRFTRGVDDPMMSAAERSLLETRYLTKGVMGVTYEGMWFDRKLKTTLFYKNYYQKVELTDPLKVDGVWTADRVDRDIAAHGYGMALSYTVRRRLVLLFSAERALRLPTDNELLGNTTDNVNPSYSLEPEKSVNLNLGANVGPFVWGRHSLSANVNFFYRDITGMIMRSVPGVSDANAAAQETTYQYVNLDNVLSRGFDAEMCYNFKDMLILTSNVSLFNARFNSKYDASGNEYPYYKARLRNSPYLTSNANLEFVKRDVVQKGSRFSAYYNCGYVHEFPRHWENIGSANKQRIPSQLVHDMGVAYTFPNAKVTLSVDARNFTDEQVFDNFALQKAGRAFYGKLSYRIF